MANRAQHWTRLKNWDCPATTRLIVSLAISELKNDY